MKSQTKKYVISFLVVIALGILLGGCQQEKEDKTIKVGTLASLTGYGAFWGDQVTKSLEIAQEEINSEGGIDGKNVSLVIEDSQSEPSKAVNAVKRLVEAEQTDFIIGDSWTPTTLASMSVINNNNVLMISPHNTVEKGSKDDFLFTMAPPIKDMAIELADHAYEKGLRRVAILSAQNPFGNTHHKYFKKRFTELGGKIVEEEKLTYSSPDARTSLTKIQEKKPDAIFVVHAINPTANILSQAKELGIEAQWLGHIGYESSVTKEHCEVYNGMIYPYPKTTYLKEEKTLEFKEKFREEYNKTASYMAINAYDTLHLLDEAIEETNGEPKEVKDYLLENEFKGAAGEYGFKENGNARKDTVIKQIDSCEFGRIDSD